ncbi:RagB/SusD family nutrient uptake outer membrane protein [uncultured Salegentibacter sp.]|uniref:RagB/SusD family nutrient uptake outer membrane protein n=1 Tax=uncultured Salegentibacter sp. TaxID=259320 RepID=UPI00259165FF|nr:RagB/SusD family nutrient uptake outer membrane protein [uncultured Salegentibacter sp.]
MKKEFRILFSLIMVFGVLSCNVDRLPETSISDPAFWQNENDLKSAANYLYTFLPGLPETGDVWSDDAFGTSANSISDGTRITPSSDGYYRAQYRLIRAANNIIEKADLVADRGGDIDQINIYVAEAKFFRSWGYFNLFRRYGGVPLILKTLNIEDEELNMGQASREEVVTQIYSDLDSALLDLKSPGTIKAEDYGRISKTAALAFKSRVALFEGTRSKFHGYGDAQKHLMIAKTAAKEVMDSGEHDIFPNYFNLFQYEGEGRQNKENILVRQYGKNLEESISYHVAQRNLETGAANPTRGLATSYLMTDGLPISKSPLYEKPTNTVEVFNNRDPRMGATFFKEGDEYIGTQPVFNIPAISFQKTGYANRRYANLNDWQVSRSYIDRTLIRYAEVLLNYAEATYELDESISDEDLNISVNILRDRESVSMPHLTNSLVDNNGLEMREEIRRERRVELALEGFRYWDLIRWKTAEIELPKTILGNYFFDEFGTEVVPEVTSDNLIILQKAENRHFDPARDYLWPFPVNQIALNPSLEQNPGW